MTRSDMDQSTTTAEGVIATDAEGTLDEKEATGGPGPAFARNDAAYENLIVGLFALSGGVAALDVQAAFFLMPFIAPDLGLDNLAIGLIGTCGLFAWSLAGFAAGPLVERLGRRKPVLIGAFLLFALFSVGASMATSFGAFIIARIMVGLAQGPVVPIEQAMVHKISSPHRLGLNMGLTQNFGAQLIGSLLGPLLLVWVAQNHGWRAAFLVAAVPGLIVAALIGVLVRDPHQAPVRGREREPLGRQIAEVLSAGNVRLCLAIGSCTVGWYFVQLGFLPLYLIQQMQISPEVMSRIMGAFGLAGLVSAAVVPALSDQLGRRRVLVGFSALAVLAPVGVALAGQNPWLLGGSVFLGCLIIGTIPLFMSTVPIEAVSPRHATTVTALVIGLTQILGGVIGPIACGALADHLGLQAILWISSALALGATLAAARLQAKPS